MVVILKKENTRYMILIDVKYWIQRHIFLHPSMFYSYISLVKHFAFI